MSRVCQVINAKHQSRATELAQQHPETFLLEIAIIVTLLPENSTFFLSFLETRFPLSSSVLTCTPQEKPPLPSTPVCANAPSRGSAAGERAGEYTPSCRQLGWAGNCSLATLQSPTILPPFPAGDTLRPAPWHFLKQHTPEFCGPSFSLQKRGIQSLTALVRGGGSVSPRRGSGCESQAHFNTPNTAAERLTETLKGFQCNVRLAFGYFSCGTLYLDTKSETHRQLPSGISKGSWCK